MLSSRRERGVTLTELMITVAIAALILTFAVPSFIEQIERQRLKSVHDELVAAMQLTRMETLSRNAPGFVKPGSNDSQTCYLFALDSSFTKTPPLGCDCGRPDNEAVCQDAEARLLGVVRVPRSTGVTISLYKDDAPDFVYFNRASGSLEVLTNDRTQTKPTEYGFRIKGSRGAEILMMMGIAGRPSSCQVGGSNLGLKQCP
jgi:prepilin-type N-terminal cleavage/methylation domain-containing protein